MTRNSPPLRSPVTVFPLSSNPILIPTLCYHTAQCPPLPCTLADQLSGLQLGNTHCFCSLPLIVSPFSAALLLAMGEGSGILFSDSDGCRELKWKESLILLLEEPGDGPLIQHIGHTIQNTYSTQGKQHTEHIQYTGHTANNIDSTQNTQHTEHTAHRTQAHTQDTAHRGHVGHRTCKHTRCNT